MPRTRSLRCRALTSAPLAPGLRPSVAGVAGTAGVAAGTGAGAAATGWPGRPDPAGAALGPLPGSCSGIGDAPSVGAITPSERRATIAAAVRSGRVRSRGELPVRSMILAPFPPRPRDRGCSAAVGRIRVRHRAGGHAPRRSLAVDELSGGPGGVNPFRYADFQFLRALPGHCNQLLQYDRGSITQAGQPPHRRDFLELCRDFQSSLGVSPRLFRLRREIARSANTMPRNRIAAPRMMPFTTRPSSDPAEEISMRWHDPYGMAHEAT